MADAVPLPLAPQGLAVAAIAPIVAGTTLQIFLSGIIMSTMAGFISTGQFARESVRMRVAVCVVVFMNMMQLAISIVDLGIWGTTQHRDHDAFLAGTKVDSLTPLVVGVAAFIVQGIYAQRVLVLLKTPWKRSLFALVTGMAIMVAFFGSLATTLLNFGYSTGKYIALGLLTFDTMTSVWLWSSFAVDVVISITMWSLLRSRVAGFNPQMDTVLKELGHLSIQTASYTALTSLLGAIASNVFLSDYTVAIAYPFIIVLPALYTISIFVTLGAKQRLNDTLAGPDASRGTPWGSTPSMFRVGRVAKLAEKEKSEDGSRHGSFRLDVREGHGSSWRVNEV